MDSIEVVLAMLLAVVASAYIKRLLPPAIPLPLVQIALGALIAAKSSHGADDGEDHQAQGQFEDGALVAQQAALGDATAIEEQQRRQEGEEEQFRFQIHAM